MKSGGRNNKSRYKIPPLTESRRNIYGIGALFKNKQTKSHHVRAIQQTNVKIHKMANSLVINSSKINYLHNKNHPQKYSKYSFNAFE